jgi:hypothetical protein
MRIGIVAAVMCAALAGEARAGSVGTVVFQLDSVGLEPGFEDVPAQLTEAIAARIDGEASQATVSDLALQLECSAEQAACIGKLRRLVKADGVVWGKLVWNAYTRTLKITLTVALDDEEPTSTTYVLESTRPGDVTDEVMGVAEGLLSQYDDEPSLPPAPPRRKKAPSIVEPASGGEVSSTTYVILGTGGAALAAGVGFYALAYGAAQEYADSPNPTTVVEARELDDLANRRDDYWTLSRVMLVGGAALATWGIVRAIGERGDPPIQVAPTLVEGGGGIAAAGRF